MGDISELRGLITVISFTATLIFLIGLMPPQFYQMDYQGRTVTPEDYWDVGDVMAFNETWTYRMNETGGEPFGDYYRIDIENAGEWFGGHDLTFYYKKANKSELDVYIYHRYAEWIIWLTGHRMDWINSEGVSREVYLQDAEMLEDQDDLSYTVKCIHFTMYGFFGYNTTTYNSVIDAWNNHDLWIRLGINFDQMNMGFNAFNLIGMLLFFQLPMVHWIINAVIAVPIWVCIFYLSFIFILRALGAIFGGGGA